MREGYGVQLYRNGDKYEGSWAGDKWDGRGTQWRMGPGRALVKVYEGEFQAGQYHGLGRLYGRDGSVYEGSFTHGQRSGQGVQRLASGDTYNGEWSGDVQHGRGRLVLDNGDTFDGHFVHGKKHGPGCVAARAAGGGGDRGGIFTAPHPPVRCRQYHYVSKRTLYVGEWVDDVARCGVMQPDEDGRSPADSSSPAFPPLGLVDSDAVLGESVAAARAEGAAALGGGGGGDHGGLGAAADLSLGDGGAGGVAAGDGTEQQLTEEDVEELRRAFASADTAGDGRIPADVQVLSGVLGALGIEASPSDAASLLRELAAQEAEDPDEEGPTGDTISFRAFLATMARLRQ